MCKYCKGEENMTDKVDTHIKVGILDESKLEIVCSSDCSGWLDLQINYCPICGRKLREEVE